MPHAGQRPEARDDGVPDAASEYVDEPAAARIHHRVGEEEQRLKPGEVGVADGDVALNLADDDGKGLAVEVVDGGNDARAPDQ